MKLTKKPANRDGEVASKCHYHPRRNAVASGSTSKKGYCRECWPAHLSNPIRSAYRLPRLPLDAAIWLAALVTLALALVGGVGCGGQDFTSMGGARPAEDAGTEGSLGSATGVGGSVAGNGGAANKGDAAGLGGGGERSKGSGGSGGSGGVAGSGGSGGSGGWSGGSGGRTGGMGGSTLSLEDGGAVSGSGGAVAGSGGAVAGSGGTVAGSGGTIAGSGGTIAGSGGTIAGSGGALGSGGGSVCVAAECPSCTISPCCYSATRCGCFAPATGCYNGHI